MKLKFIDYAQFFRLKKRKEKSPNWDIKIQFTSFNLSRVVRVLASCLGLPKIRVNMVD